MWSTINDVYPLEIILPFFSMTHPTDGFSFVEPKFIFANSKANFIFFTFLIVFISFWICHVTRQYIHQIHQFL